MSESFTTTFADVMLYLRGLSAMFAIGLIPALIVLLIIQKENLEDMRDSIKFAKTERKD